MENSTQIAKILRKAFHSQIDSALGNSVTTNSINYTNQLISNELSNDNAADKMNDIRHKAKSVAKIIRKLDEKGDRYDIHNINSALHYNKEAHGEIKGLTDIILSSKRKNLPDRERFLILADVIEAHIDVENIIKLANQAITFKDGKNDEKTSPQERKITSERKAKDFLRQKTDEIRKRYNLPKRTEERTSTAYSRINNSNSTRQGRYQR